MLLVERQECIQPVKSDTSNCALRGLRRTQQNPEYLYKIRPASKTVNLLKFFNDYSCEINLHTFVLPKRSTYGGVLDHVSATLW